MSIIKTHDITLYGGSGSDIVLRPLCDDHLPYLYKWCADPEVLYWTEGGTADEDLSYGPDTVHQIYGGVSQKALCFLIEADGIPIGECWLQRMNLPDVMAMYPEDLDVRRIDMCIGEKGYWNRGIGTQFIGMLVDFAFSGEHVDVLHCFCEDYNIRSRRMWEKHGFTQILAVSLPVDKGGIYRAPSRKGTRRTTVFTPYCRAATQPALYQPRKTPPGEGMVRPGGPWTLRSHSCQEME
jgi:aminoglycoside 6'-N-acetyltransferase